MTASAPVKLGILGCGLAANGHHLPALNAMPRLFEIAAVCNNTEDKAVEFAKKAGEVPYYLDYRQLLARKDIEAIDIALPFPLNYEITSQVLAAAKHVLVEKPIAGNVQQARKMVDLDGRYPQVKMVAENFYYHQGFLRVRELIDDGRIGTPYAVFWDLFRHMDMNNKYAKTSWRIDHEYPGGFITDGGVHFIAALKVIFDDIVGGRAFTYRANPALGEFDSFSFQFETAAGIRGVLNFFLSVDDLFRNSMVILGTEGNILLENTEQISLRRAGKVVYRESIEGDWGYQAEFRNFYHAIRDGQPIVSTFSKACRDLEILMAALDSARNWPMHGLNI